MDASHKLLKFGWFQEKKITWFVPSHRTSFLSAVVWEQNQTLADVCPLFWMDIKFFMTIQNRRAHVHAHANV